MSISTMRKDLTFAQAGHFKLQKFKADGTLDPNNIYNSLNQIVKSVKRATTTTTNELPDGNSPYAAHDYVTKEETIVTIGLSTYDPYLEAFVKNATFKADSADAEDFYFVQMVTIPDGLSVALEKPVSGETAEITVRDKFGNAFTKGETAAAGTYTLAVASTGEKIATLTFAEADKGKEVSILYVGSVTGVTSIEHSENPKNADMQVAIIGASTSYDEAQSQNVNIIIDKATLNGGLTPPEMTKDPTGGWEIAFKTGKPRAGKKPVMVKFLPK